MLIYSSLQYLPGATQEFKEEPLDIVDVEAELRRRSDAFASHIWKGSSVDRVTTGFRVQSNRGKNGRMPILGRLDTPVHNDAWIFTGLSSRGLLYHGIFGDYLSNIILKTGNENPAIDPEDLDWWIKKKKN